MDIVLPGIPELSWTHGRGDAIVEGTGTLILTAAGGVDWITNASGAPPKQDATALVFDAPEGDFMLSARVEVPGTRSRFDAGSLVLWSDPAHWAKLCFEYSPQGEAMVVSVVTNDYSDDCNSSVVTEPHVWLRVARVGPALVLHSSADGARWDFVRTFRLASAAPVRVGFLSQAPRGEGCVARFDDIRYVQATLTDLRDGS